MVLDENIIEWIVEMYGRQGIEYWNYLQKCE